MRLPCLCYGGETSLYVQLWFALPGRGGAVHTTSSQCSFLFFFLFRLPFFFFFLYFFLFYARISKKKYEGILYTENRKQSKNGEGDFPSFLNSLLFIYFSGFSSSFYTKKGRSEAYLRLMPSNPRLLRHDQNQVAIQGL